MDLAFVAASAAMAISLCTVAGDLRIEDSPVGEAFEIACKTIEAFALSETSYSELRRCVNRSTKEVRPSQFKAWLLNMAMCSSAPTILSKTSAHHVPTCTAP